jgi:hypothetical protein
VANRQNSPKENGSSRRRIATAGLGSLAALLGAHRVEAAAFLGADRRQFAAADSQPPTNRQPEPHAAPMIVDVTDFGARGDAVSDEFWIVQSRCHGFGRG